jgi:DNA invertase Pin-like site-specific DNA recombinase
MQQQNAKDWPRLLQCCGRGDTFVVWKLDRLGTSIKALVRILTLLEEQGSEFKSLTENIDTTTRGGKQLFQIIGAFRTLMREKTKPGLRVARTRGRKGGRPKALNASDIKTVQELYAKRDIPVPEICQQMKISRMTLYRYVKPKEKHQAGLPGFVRRLRGLGE